MGQDYSELLITESTFDSQSSFFVRLFNNTKIKFYGCIFLRFESSFALISNSTAQINDSDIMLNNVYDDPFVSVYGQSKVYIQNSNIANNSFGSFICADSGSYLKIENCSYFNNTGKEDQSTFFIFNNNSLVIQNSYFNDNKVDYLIQTTSSSILFQETSFCRSMNTFMEGVSNRVSIYDCSIYFDDDAVSELSDSVLNIRNSNLIGCVFGMIGSRKFNSYVNVINSVFNNSMITMLSSDINIAEFHFEHSLITLNVGTPEIRIANSRFDSSGLFLTSLGGDEETCFQTLDTIFIGRASSVKSNAKHFMDKAEKEELIFGETSRLKHIETAYASGKHYVFFQIQPVGTSLISA